MHGEFDALGKPNGLIINGADKMNYGGSDAYLIGATKCRPKFPGWFRV